MLARTKLIFWFAILLIIFSPIQVNASGVTKQTLEHNQAENIQNGVEAYADTDGTWIYYAAFSSDKGNIHKIRINGTGKEIRFNTGNARQLFVKDGWIYYLQGSGGWDNYAIYKMTTNGTRRTKLSGPRIDKIIVAGDWIYYNVIGKQCCVGEHLYRMKTDGSNKKKIYTKSISDFYVFSGSLYFLGDKGSIRKMNLDGTKEKVLYNEEKVSSLHITKEWLYFTKQDGSGLFKMKENGTELALVREDINYALFQGNTFYYLASEPKPGYMDAPLMKMELGKEPVEVIFDAINYYSVVGDWIYYRTMVNMYRVKTDGTHKEEI